MLDFVKDRLDAFFGRNRHSTSVPGMDGPWHPNETLDAAEVLFGAEGVDNLCHRGDALLYSAGSMVYSLAGDETVTFATMPAAVSCLAAGPGDLLAIGLEGQGIVMRDGEAERRVEALDGVPLVCPTDLAFLVDGTLVVTVGSETRQPSEWKHDLVARGRGGSVWAIDPGTLAARCLARGLEWPNGVAEGSGGDVIVSEAWRSRLLAVGLWDKGAPREALADLPAYPARIRRSEAGGYHLALFAPRNQLLEFILQEKRFRERMMTEIDPQHWLAPSLRSRESFLEPLQGGGVIQMGILKPWAPALSYGLVVELNADIVPVASWHSRANGERHGTTSVCAHDGEILVAAKGDGVVLILPEAEGGSI